MRGERSDAGDPLVVKIGGRALAAPGAPGELASDLARHCALGPVLVVHGGGAEIDDWCRRLGLEPRFADGLRVTDDATLEVTVAVLAGLANRRLVARLRAAGVDAVGLSAADGGIASVEPHPDRTLGHVARIVAVDPRLPELLLDAGRTPVLSSVAERGGELWNVNADELAGRVAAALRARALVLLSDAPGLELGGRTVERLDAGAIEDALERPEVTGGMRPKLLAATSALRGGAGRVHLGAWSGDRGLTRLLEGAAPATVIEPVPAAGVRA